MTVTLNCLRGYPASTSDLQILHSLSQCNITSSALFQMSGSDKNSLCDCVCVCACLRLWSHTNVLLYMRTIVSLKYAEFLPVALFHGSLISQSLLSVWLSAWMFIHLSEKEEEEEEENVEKVTLSFPPYTHWHPLNVNVGRRLSIPVSIWWTRSLWDNDSRWVEDPVPELGWDGWVFLGRGRWECE